MNLNKLQRYCLLIFVELIQILIKLYDVMYVFLHYLCIRSSIYIGRTLHAMYIFIYIIILQSWLPCPSYNGLIAKKKKRFGQNAKIPFHPHVQKHLFSSKQT